MPAKITKAFPKNGCMSPNQESHIAGFIDGNKIPAIGDLPILGRLFGSTVDNVQKTEIVLSITPHVIRNIHRPLVNEGQFSAGTETNLKPRPESGSSDSGGQVNAGPAANVRKNRAPPIRVAPPVEAAVAPASGAEVIPVLPLPPSNNSGQPAGVDSPASINVP